MNVFIKEKKWIVVITILALSLLVSTVFSVQLYQRQEKLHASSLQLLDERNRQLDLDNSALTSDLSKTITELQTQLTNQEIMLAETAARLDLISEENELLKKKLQ